MDKNEQSRIEELRKQALEELNKEEKAKAADMGVRIKKHAAELVREVAEASQKSYGKAVESLILLGYGVWAERKGGGSAPAPKPASTK